MRTVYNCFEKGRETHEKKKKTKLFSRTKLKPVYQTKKKIDEAHEFYFTNMKIVLQKCVPKQALTRTMHCCFLLFFYKYIPNKATKLRRMKK